MGALREIRRLQKSTDWLLPRAPFQRLVREIVQDVSMTNYYCMARSALGALQEITKSYMVGFFAQTQLLACHAKRVTVTGSDFQLLATLQSELGVDGEASRAAI